MKYQINRNLLLTLCVNSLVGLNGSLIAILLTTAKHVEHGLFYCIMFMLFTIDHAWHLNTKLFKRKGIKHDKLQDMFQWGAIFCFSTYFIIFYTQLSGMLFLILFSINTFIALMYTVSIWLYYEAIIQNNNN